MPQTLPEATPSRAGARRLPRQLAVDVALPWAAVLILEHAFATPPLTAFALAALIPAAAVLAAFLGRRQIDWIGAAVLATLMTGILTALATGELGFAALKAAPAFGLFGLASLVSAWRRRPLMFFVARAFEAGDDPAKVASWNARLNEPRFVAVMQRLSVIWGLDCLAEAGAGIAVAFLAPHIALIAEPLLGLGTVAALLAWTYAISPAAPQPVAAGR